VDCVWRFLCDSHFPESAPACRRRTIVIEVATCLHGRAIFVLLVQVNPASVGKIEEWHVVELLRNLENASEKNHVVEVNSRRVATSRHRNSFGIFHLDKFPPTLLDMETPQVVQLDVLSVLAAEDVHLVSLLNVVVDDSGVAGSWAWLVCVGVLKFDLLPQVFLQVELVNVVGTFAVDKSTEEDDCLANKNTALLVVGSRNIFGVSIQSSDSQLLPHKLAKVQRVHALIAVKVKTTTEQVHLVVLHNY